MTAVAALGVIFLLFSVNTTLAWSTAVVALVGLFGEMSNSWETLWKQVAGEESVPEGLADAAMLSTRSFALVAQPFVLGMLLNTSSNVAAMIIGALCLACAALFLVTTRKSSIAANGEAAQRQKAAA